jgi:hypothetical protein
VVLEEAVEEVFIQQHRDQMALLILVAVVVVEPISLWHLALAALAS